MRSSGAAKRYAKALFSIARDDGAIPAIRGELDGLAQALEQHPKLRLELFRPLRPAAERRAVLRAVCEQTAAGTTLRNFLTFLIDQRRLVDFDSIKEEYERLADEAAGRIQADVIAASPLADAQRGRLQAALAQRTGQDVELVVTVDPNLIGGAIAKVGGVVFDSSLRTQLSLLRDNLTRG